MGVTGTPVSLHASPMQRLHAALDVPVLTDMQVVLADMSWQLSSRESSLHMHSQGRLCLEGYLVYSAEHCICTELFGQCN